MMKRATIADLKDFLAGAIIIGIILFCIAAVLWGIFGKFYTCPARWKESGLSAEYHFLVGCMVTRKDGTKVPEKVLRDMTP